MKLFNAQAAVFFAAASLSLAGDPVASLSRLPQGGGAIYPSWKAQYFANPKLEGKPAWEKTENRINFDWEDWRPILGIQAESVKDFSHDNFSARFAATIVARFGEEYTFKLTSDEGGRLKIKPQGSSDWKTIIDAWAPHKKRTDSAAAKLEAGKKYDVELEYYNLTGEAVCELRWQSPSTPDEVIDYAAANTYRQVLPGMSANLMDHHNAKFPMDENGWPTADCKWTLFGGYSFYPGRHLLRFDGQAEVRWKGVKFAVNGETVPDVLPLGKGYDAAKNQTTAFVDVTGDPDGCARGGIEFAKTRRTPTAPEGSGVTRIYIMRPRKAGGSESQEPGEIASGEWKDAMLPVYAVRIQTTGLSDTVEWKDRTVPAYSQFGEQHSHNQLCYEKLILAFNEAGRDLHLNFGGSINYEFMEKLAKLTRYGSDGENPYDKPTKNPKYPPLNPNLRLYLEHGNEMGWSAIQPREWANDYKRIRQAKQEPEWSVLNFDGKIEGQTGEFPGLMRYHAYRTVRMSQAMRKVWGDAAMGEKVRVMIFGAYLRAFQNDFPQFIDDYYNNGAGKFVNDPHPASYYFWGAGGAIYYSTSNPWAVGKTPVLANNSFEEYPVEAGKAALAPKGAGWSFGGTTGVVDVRYPRYTLFEPVAVSGEKALAQDSLVGTRITVGAKNIYVYEVGRQSNGGNEGKRTVGIFTSDGKSVATSRAATVDLKGAKAGEARFAPLEYCLWATSDSARVGIWRLDAGKSYVVVSQESAGKVSAPMPLKAGPGISIDGAVEMPGGKISSDIVGAIQVSGGPGTGFPLATFRYTDQVLAPAPGLAIVPPDPSVDPDYAKGGKGASLIPPSHRTGSKMAFIAGQGKMSQKFKIDEAGDYAFVFSGVAGCNGGDCRSPNSKDNPLTIKIDGKVVWNRALPVGARKAKYSLFQYGSEYVRLEPGEHEVIVEGTNEDAAAVTYIDAAHMGSMLDMAGGPTAPNFLGAGTATSGGDDAFDVSARGMAGMAQIWGLVPYCYEGGTLPGGDWNGGGVLYAMQFKESNPLSKVADSQWAELWHKAGGANAMFYYEGFPDKFIQVASKYLQWEAAIERAHEWQYEPTEGTKLPAQLTCEMKHFQGESASDWKTFVAPWQTFNKPNPRGPELKKQQWKAWVVNVPVAREYEIALNASGEGKVRLSVNDSQILASGPAGKPVAGKAWLHKGIHTIKVKCEEGAVAVQNVDVK